MEDTPMGWTQARHNGRPTLDFLKDEYPQFELVAHEKHGPDYFLAFAFTPAEGSAFKHYYEPKPDGRIVFAMVVLTERGPAWIKFKEMGETEGPHSPGRPSARFLRHLSPLREVSDTCVQYARKWRMGRNAYELNQ
jgi:hypothetical protein